MVKRRRPFDVGLISDDEAERRAQLLAYLLTDPTLPENQLKRPVWRRCLRCEQRYQSRVSALCDTGFCGEECERLFNAPFC